MVFVVRMVAVATGVEVVVLDPRSVAVAGEAEDVFVMMGDLVPAAVGFIVLLAIILGVS